MKSRLSAFVALCAVLASVSWGGGGASGCVSAIWGGTGRAEGLACASQPCSEWTLNPDTHHEESYAEETQPFLGTARSEVAPPHSGGARTSSGGQSPHSRDDGGAVCVRPLFHSAVLPCPQRSGIRYLHSIMVLRL